MQGHLLSGAADDGGGVVVFLAIPADIMRVICLFLPLMDLLRFLGGTCQSIRRAYFTLSEVFTDARPMYMPVDAELQHTWMAPSMQALVQRTLPGDKAIPVHAYITPRRLIYYSLSPRADTNISDPIAWDHQHMGLQGRCRVPLSSINYKVRRLAVTPSGLMATFDALVHRREWQHVHEVDFESEFVALHDLPESVRQHQFPSVKRIWISVTVGDIDLGLLEQIFPNAGVWVTRMCTDLNSTWQSPTAEYHRKLLDVAGIVEMRFTTGPVPELANLYWQCMHRTIGVFNVSQATTHAWQDMIADALKIRLAHRCFYQLDAYLDWKDRGLSNARIVDVLGKYITGLYVCWQPTQPAADWAWNGLASVRRFGIYCETPGRHESETTTTIAVPPGVTLERKFRAIAQDVYITSTTPLRPADMAYLFYALPWAVSPDTVDMGTRGDATAFSAALEALRSAHVADYDHAFRVYYEFIPQDSAIKPIRGYV